MIENIQVIEEVLRKCGSLLLRMKEDRQLSYKQKGTQIKSLADMIVNEFLVSNLRKINPHISIVSEENTLNICANKINFLDECFIIDPIDGTASFVGGYQGYVVQIAYLKKGIVEFSMVYAPEFNDLYLGINGEGAYLNGKLLNVNVDLTSPVYIDSYPEPQLSIIKMMGEKENSKYIECGSIGLKICKIADGKADFLYKDVTVRDWDLIPPSLILKESGGLLLSLKAEQIKYFNSPDYSHHGFVATSSEVLLENLKYLS